MERMAVVLIVIAVSSLWVGEAFAPRHGTLGLRSSRLFGPQQQQLPFSPQELATRTLLLFSETSRLPMVDGSRMTSVMGTSPATTTTQPSQPNESYLRSILRRVDEEGMGLKLMALKSKDLVLAQTTILRKVRFAAQSSALFLAFLCYRASRGAFTVLPPVFQMVYSKLETAVDSPFAALDDHQEDENAITPVRNYRDVHPKTGRVRLRTVLTISFLASIVTMSYVLGGAWRIAIRFIRALISSKSVPASLEAAATELMTNESKILAVTSMNGFSVNGHEPVNGERK